MITPESIVARDDGEFAHQVALFCWAATCGIPDVDLMHHIPNGERRDVETAGRLKASGVKPGVPDICWPVRAKLGLDILGGLYIELKRLGNMPTVHQTTFMRRLLGQGYYVTTCYTWKEAASVVLWYNSLR